MSTRQHNITIHQGATFELGATWRDGDGDPLDLTDCTARMQVRRKFASETALVSLTTDANGGITIDELGGRVAVTITAAQTAELPARMWGRYDLELEYPSGKVVRMLQGKVYVDPEVTR